MDITAIKSQFDMAQDIAQYINSRFPKADIYPNSVLRDLLIEAPSEFYYGNYETINFLSMLLNFTDLNNLLQNPVQQANIASAMNIDVKALASFISSYIDALASNYGLSRKTATSASGVLTFYTNVATSLPITISSGTVVQTNSSNPLTYTTDQTATIGTDPNTYFNPTTGYFEVLVSATASDTGAATNAGANTLIVIPGGQTASTAGLQCTNTTPFKGGLDNESDINLLDRVITALQGNFRGSISGITGMLKQWPYVADALVVNGLENAYGIGEDLSDITAWISAPNSTIVTDTNTYIGGNIPLMNNPATSVLSVTFDDYTVPPCFYTFIQDTTSLDRYSSAANDYVGLNLSGLGIYDTATGTPGLSISSTDNITGTGHPITLTNTYQMALQLSASVYFLFPAGTAGQVVGGPTGALPYLKFKFNGNDITPWVLYDSTAPSRTWAVFNYSTCPYTSTYTTSNPPPQSGFTVEITPIAGVTSVGITYIYNKYIKTMDDYLNSDAIKFVGQNVTVRASIPVPVNVTVLVQIPSASVSTAVRAGIIQALTAYINSYKLNFTINETDLIDLIMEVSNVLNVAIPFTVLSTSTTGTGDIQGIPNAYYYLNNIVVNLTTQQIIN